MMHLQNALARLKQSGTACQYLIVMEVQHEAQRLADAYDRVEKTLKETQDAAYWFLDSLQYAANTKVSMNTQQKITALRNALDKSGYRPIGRDESPLPPPKNPNGRPDHIADADKMVLDDPHPPHRLCECTACLEYWTPKPDCDHIAASGKVIALTAEAAQQIEEAFENAESVAASINAGKHHVIQVDDEKCFWQREEWVRWAIDEVLPEIREALATIRAARAQKPTDCPCCGAKGTVIPSAFCRECKSDFWPPSVPANPMQPD